MSIIGDILLYTIIGINIYILIEVAYHLLGSHRKKRKLRFDILWYQCKYNRSELK